MRPTHISLAEEGLSGELYLLENLGESMLLNLSVGDDLLKVRLPEIRRFADNESLKLAFDPRCVHLFDPQTHLRID